MADLLPSFPDTSEAGGEEPRVVGIDSDDAEDLLSALSSDTARAILATLHEEPSTPAGIAEAVDTSIQNVQYHLGSLQEANVVEVADVAYSEKGREMKVYAPSDRALVVVAGRDEETGGLKAALSRLLGGVGVLGLASVVVQRLVTSGALGPRPPTADPGGTGEEYDGAETGGEGGATAATERTPPEETATPTATDGDVGAMDVQTETEATETVTEAAATTEPATTAEPATTELARTTAEAAAGGGADGVAAVATAPGTLFFVGGLLVLVALVALDARR
jgi:DNA-binding transcriptional ArsR family regulator